MFIKLSDVDLKNIRRDLKAVKWCLMPSAMSADILGTLRPVPKHGSINIYIHGSQKAR